MANGGVEAACRIGPSTLSLTNAGYGVNRCDMGVCMFDFGRDAAGKLCLESLCGLFVGGSRVLVSMNDW